MSWIIFATAIALLRMLCQTSVCTRVETPGCGPAWLPLPPALYFIHRRIKADGETEAFEKSFHPAAVQFAVVRERPVSEGTPAAGPQVPNLRRISGTNHARRPL